MLIPAALMLIAVILLISGRFVTRSLSLTDDALPNIKDIYSNGSGYVIGSVKELDYAGIDYIVRNKTAGRVYYTIKDGKCYYFILSSSHLPKDYYVLEDYVFQAKLITDTELLRKINSQMSTYLEFPIKDIESATSSVIISEYHLFHSFGTLYIILLLAVIITALITMISTVVIIIFPSKSISIRRLGKYGSRYRLYINAMLEYEEATELSDDKISLSENFIFINAPIFLDIVPINNIERIYKLSEVHHTKTNISVTTPLCIITDKKELYKIHMVSDSLAALITTRLLKINPEIIIGYRTADNNTSQHMT